MKSVVKLLVMSLLACACALAQTSVPRIIASDLQSGPRTGGPNNKGTIVTLYGFAFGATQGTSTISVGGVPAGSYLLWSDTKVSFQIGSSALTGNILLSTTAGVSNPKPFTVRTGRLLFVSTSGADTNSGGFSSPWHTVTKATASSQPGDIIYLMNGISQTALNSSSASLAIANSGTSTAPIALVAYPGATATIGSSTGQQYGIRTTATANNWVLSGLTLRGAFAALAISNSANWRVMGNDISCPNGSGTGACLAAIALTNGIFYRNRVHDVGSTTSTSLKLYQAVQFDLGSNAIDFGWNEIANTRSCRALQFYSDTTPLFNLTVRNNLIHDARCDGINFATIDPAKGAVQAYNNVIYRVGTGPAPGGIESSYAGIKVAGTNSAPVQLTNNTFYDCGGRDNADSGSISASASVVVVNNIINSLNGETYVAPNSTAGVFSGSNNLFFGAGATPTFSSASKNADPKFVTPGSNFGLQSVSPAIDAGISSGFNRDIIQTPRPLGTAYDMGAYEYTGASASPTPSPTPTPTPAPTPSPSPTPTPTPTPSPTPTPTGSITVTPTSLAFGTVVIGSTANQTVTISNPSTVSVSISKVAVSGTGFAASALTLPLTLASGQSVPVTVKFSPQTSGAVTGSLQITTSASTTPTTVVLSGTGGTIQHSVTLSWAASSSSASGYNVYRSTTSGGPYTKLNSTLLTALTYTDSTVSSGATYYYVVTDLTSGVESGFSNQATAVVPTP
jgi:hypothetical protein